MQNNKGNTGKGKEKKKVERVCERINKYMKERKEEEAQ